MAGCGVDLVMGLTEREEWRPGVRLRRIDDRTKACAGAGGKLRMMAVVVVVVVAVGVGGGGRVQQRGQSAPLQREPSRGGIPSRESRTRAEQ